MGRPSSDLRERAVRAAITLAADHGAAGVTFDAVAAAVGASKGAILHHFRTKHALLQAAVEGIVLDYRTDILSRVAVDPNPVGAFTRALLRYAVPAELNRAIRGMLALILEERALGKPFDDLTLWCHERIRHDGIDPVVAAVVMTATDGFWLGEIVGVPPLPNDLQTGSYAWLASLVEREVERATATPPESTRAAAT